MFGRTKEWSELEGMGEFLPDDEQARTAAMIAELRERLTVVETQLKSQYLSMAAYAQIAQEQVDFARAEARADHDRGFQTLVGLMEQLRAEYRLTADDRVAALEQEVAALRAELAELRAARADATPSVGMPMPLAAQRVDLPFAPQVAEAAIDPWLAEPVGDDQPIDELSMY
jgi:DNA repair exonuclease SbcCD ATPase subunit